MKKTVLESLRAQGQPPLVPACDLLRVFQLLGGILLTYYLAAYYLGNLRIAVIVAVFALLLLLHITPILAF